MDCHEFCDIDHVVSAEWRTGRTGVLVDVISMLVVVIVVWGDYHDVAVAGSFFLAVE